MSWREYRRGLVETGHDGHGFAFDNEGPRHRSWLDAFALARRPVSCAEYLEFIEDGGYRRPEFWLSAGWDCVKQRGWEAPSIGKDRTAFGTPSPCRVWSGSSPAVQSVMSVASRRLRMPSGGQTSPARSRVGDCR